VIEHLINWVTHVIATLGYPGVLLLMALESACIPIPSEAIMPFAGAQITMHPEIHRFDLHTLAFVGAFGNLLGSIVAYWIGSIGGRPFIEKYGKYVLIRRRDLDRSEQFFNKYGEITALASRLLPIIRTFISLPAGIARMNFPRFCVYTFIGALPFCYLLTWAGIYLGKNWAQVHVWLHNADLAISVVLLVLFGLWLKHHLRPDDDEPLDKISGTKSPATLSKE
jgi:membrane protein DedA with SNARE-associated domain